MIESVFFLAGALLFYTFIGYPVLIVTLARGKVGVLPTLGKLPSVSVIIVAHNEEAIIAAKLDNVLQIDYPPDRFEIIIASDHSTDRTDEIVRNCAVRGVKLVCLGERRGKVAAQDFALQHSTGEIVIFSDASTFLKADIVQKLVRHFADPMVGCVSGEDRSLSSTDQGKVEDEGLYVRYEMFIRRAESRLGCLVGASGCCFAIRRTLWTTFDISLAEDFILPLLIRERGFKTVSDSEAIAYVHAVASPHEEFVRRVRTATQGIMSLFEMRRLLNPWHAGSFSLALISHKLCRFLVPFFLLVALLTNVALAGTHPIYSVALGVQIIFYGAAVAGWVWRRKGPRVISLPLYLVIVQCAIVRAWICAGLGHRCATWSPSRRLYRQHTSEAD
jgi:cellulose synthase/poly-beta-1,6-N-acetylglucosamine synthase-like glycosyltransferase